MAKDTLGCCSSQFYWCCAFTMSKQRRSWPSQVVRTQPQSQTRSHSTRCWGQYIRPRPRPRPNYLRPRPRLWQIGLEVETKSWDLTSMDNRTSNSFAKIYENLHWNYLLAVMQKANLMYIFTLQLLDRNSIG